MSRKALVVIDIQNDITKHYREIIDRINDAIDWAVENGLEVVYIKHNNLSAGTRANALTSVAFSEYIQGKDIDEFYITGADATACVKSTCFNMTKAGYNVHVISDCVTSYDLKKMDEMLAYYSAKGCEVKTLKEYKDFGVTDEGQS